MNKVLNIVDFPNTLTNYTLVDGVTPEIIKRKYIWLLNAIVKDAIIGQDDYGLVWYSGEWIAGEWEDGTWYSGIWYDGEWKNGKWYSYRYDNKQLLQRNKRVLEKDNPENSQFRKGIWRRGEFYNGLFGSPYFNETWKYKSKIECEYYETRWENGIFLNGIFRNATWQKGIFQNGIFYNSQWIDGTFINGTFEGYTWWNGNFTGGDFILGEWMNGRFSQGDTNVKSRFGSRPLTGTNMIGTSVIWYNGEFINGEFHSGLNIISGVTSISDNHNRTVWKNGIWYNGTWYGGTHVDGEFNNGYWFEGFWSGGTFNNGYWWNGFWLNGIVNNGYFVHGTFQNVIFNHGFLGFEISSDIIQKELSAKSGSTTLEPKYLSTPPTVITEFVTGITQYTATCYGNATDDGGSPITQKGICWSTKSYFLLNESDTDYTIDGSGVGEFFSVADELDRGTAYYIKAYAKNEIGTAFGEEIYFTTTWY